MMTSLATNLVFLVFFVSIANVHATCHIKTTEVVQRLGLTPFFIIHGSKRKGFVSQPEARLQCQEHGLSLALIRDSGTMAHVSRELEKIGFRELLRDTWYWLDAVFDERSQMYHWRGSVSDPVKYSNFLYRPPRPTGIGKHVDYRRRYKPELNLTQCLTLALPWPWPKAGSSDVKYGHQTIFDEKYCLSKTSRHALCVVDDGSCNSYSNSTFHINENTFKQYEEGNWIFGDRKYIVNYHERSFHDSQEYCKKLGLQILTPGLGEKFLIPHVKMWTRAMTGIQFWTNMKFNPKTKEFVDNNGFVVANKSTAVDWKNRDTFRKDLTLKEGSTYCVALSLSYEFNEQMPCSDFSNPTCTWSFIKYIPANCNNYHSVICQHKDHRKRTITWDKIYVHDLTNLLQKHALTNFGYDSNHHVLRSMYKQTFGACYCPNGYTMEALRDNSETTTPQLIAPSLYKPRDISDDDLYLYDYFETYWVLDQNGYHKTSYSKCAASFLNPVADNKYARVVKYVSCTELHHYLCRRYELPPKEKNDFNPKFVPEVLMEWREGPQPRFYPVIINSTFADLETLQFQKSLSEFSAHSTLIIYAQIMTTVDKIRIRLVDQTDGKEKIVLQIEPVFSTKEVVLNTFDKEWGAEQVSSTFPFRKGYTFELTIKCDEDAFNFFLDGKNFGSFKYRIPVEKVNHIRIYGGVHVVECLYD